MGEGLGGRCGGRTIRQGTPADEPHLATPGHAASRSNARALGRTQHMHVRSTTRGRGVALSFVAAFALLASACAQQQAQQPAAAPTSGGGAATTAPAGGATTAPAAAA